MTAQLRNRLKVQRAISDVTQAELAIKAGVTRKSVNAIETGRMVPSVLLALKLARALEVPIETIFMLDAAAGVQTNTPAERETEN